jgi:kinesin family protein 20
MQGDKDVLMRAPIVSLPSLCSHYADPKDTHRPTIPKAPHLYSFDRVFGPQSSQTDFFANTALPLVDQLLKGENGLLFAYGVSNSGKTYSVSGGNTINSADRGVLPRAIDVVFNSIKGLESTASVSFSTLARAQANA